MWHSSVLIFSRKPSDVTIIPLYPGLGAILFHEYNTLDNSVVGTDNEKIYHNQYDLSTYYASHKI